MKAKELREPLVKKKKVDHFYPKANLKNKELVKYYFTFISTCSHVHHRL